MIYMNEKARLKEIVSILKESNFLGGITPEKVCKTITAHMKFDCNMYIHPWEARGLSPREAARIQTFPDDYVITGSQNMWYAQVGNAVPVKLAKAIGDGIMKFV